MGVQLIHEIKQRGLQVAHLIGWDGLTQFTNYNIKTESSLNFISKNSNKLKLVMNLNAIS